MNCPFCNGNAARAHWYPTTSFAGKTFTYVDCQACRLVYVDPIPTAADLSQMYRPDYQAGVNTSLLSSPHVLVGGLRFSYAEQFRLVREQDPRAHILDFGCGDGHFVANALAQGFPVTGVEFNRDQVQLLASAMPDADFLTVDDFFAGSRSFPVVRLSNVLEHLTDVQATSRALVDKLAPGGMLLIEGPLEANANVAYFVRQAYFRLRRALQPGRLAAHPPFHVFFANRDNQRRFFARVPLDEHHFAVTERGWPFPERLADVSSVGGFAKYVIARASMTLSGRVPGWGNTFIYAGRKPAPARPS